MNDNDKTLFLVCNAHLDPVWLWEWEEGAAEALSTFRTAAQLCEEFEEFVFTHNEALLYQWIEEYEPDLFVKIKALVKKKKWHILGGWYVQPDCNMPSGESFVRQILAGKMYFKKKFGVEPKTAINFDPFGHTRGLVQILRRAGYTSYLFCRPDQNWLPLPGEDFIWVGYDGSEILAHRAIEHYNSPKGQAAQRVRKWMADNHDRNVGILLWGIGNHGGGPSREDLKQLRKLMAEGKNRNICHGRPEDYFTALKKQGGKLPHHSKDLNPWAVGCYTSMAAVKKKHRDMENLYYGTEKMVTHASLVDLMPYPREKLNEALEDLLFCEFHDILPGSGIPEVEDHAQQRLDHGLEILSRLRTRSFFALLGGQPQAKEGEFPIFVYNHHPFPLKQIVVCEFQPHEPHFEKKSVLVPEVRNHRGKKVLSQMEKESSTLSVEWRKRVVFRADLKPGQMNRFVCRLKNVTSEPDPLKKEKPLLVLRSDKAEWSIRTTTGLLESYKVNGIDFLKSRAFQALVMEDDPDSWGMKVRSFRNYEGKFSAMPEQERAQFAGVAGSRLENVRIIEEGAVRTVIEALFQYNQSYICQRYKIPKTGSEFEVEVRVLWNEKDRMLKMAIPSIFRNGHGRGQVAYGVEEFGPTEDELVAQKWVSVVSSDNQHALTVINDRVYGFDFKGGEFRISLLRSPAFAADMGDSRSLRIQDRFIPRMDQGEKIFRFWINGGKASERLTFVDREAVAKNEAPMAICCFPSGGGKKIPPSLVLSDKAIQVPAVKMAENRNWLVCRLFEPTGKSRKTKMTILPLNINIDVTLGAFELKTIAVDLRSKEMFELDLVERRLKTQGSLFKPE
ncbi:MAG: alpha-mannosidase [Candidatus Aminicenantes bacterium]|nr:MAG: alpha-mannosidase [Candidatus Aminicenantes bacterium]